MLRLLSPRYFIAALILAGVIGASFLFSVPHAREVSAPARPVDLPATSSPPVSLRDAYRKGTHTLSGTVLAPDACAPVSARATLVDNASTTNSIALAITLSPSVGVCLMLPTPIPFSTTVAAPRDTPIETSVNGAPASTTPA